MGYLIWAALHFGVTGGPLQVGAQVDANSSI